MAQYLDDEARWQAVRERDVDASGVFVYAVATTGIYCRPGCASRRPKRENVRFFDDWRAAEAAGFRPCKRCQPRDENPTSPYLQAIIDACRRVAESEREPTLAELAAGAGLSASQFARVFKAQMGVTPKQYAMSHRAERLREALTETERVTDAVYEAGYESGSRAYDPAAQGLGMTPGAWKAGGEGVAIRYALAPCELGWALVAASERGVCLIALGDEPEALETELRERLGRAERVTPDDELDAVLSAALRVIDGQAPAADLPLDIRGTAFQRRVWQALQRIPSGATASYGQVAARIGKPKAARAVARACATNPVAVAVPCHRVVRGDGGLGGYRWGIERKRRLLDREASHAGEGAACHSAI